MLLFLLKFPICRVYFWKENCNQPVSGSLNNINLFRLVYEKCYVRRDCFETSAIILFKINIKILSVMLHLLKYTIKKSQINFNEN